MPLGKREILIGCTVLTLKTINSLCNSAVKKTKAGQNHTYLAEEERAGRGKDKAKGGKGGGGKGGEKEGRGENSEIL